MLQFVKDGGTLITLNASSQLPLDHFKVPLRNVAQSYPSTEFFCPSAILKVDVENTHPIAYGMENTANVLSYGSPFFEFLDTEEMNPDEKQTWLSDLTLIAKSSKHENAKQPHWAQARSSCWGTRSPPL